MTGQGRGWMPVQTRVVLVAVLLALTDVTASEALPCS